MADDHAALAADHAGNAETAAQSLHGWTLVEHKLEVAFVHALAGAADPAHEALDAAMAEIARFAPSFDHLARGIELAIAKVHAALASHGKPAAKKATA